MDLKDFYFQNIQKDEYHYRFYDSIENVNNVYNIFSGYTEVENYEFEVYDAEEAITKFRELCQPDVDFSGNENKCWFYLISYYLYKVGYVIKEFSRLLARPPVAPSDFTYGEIRNRIIAKGDDDNGTVRYAVRRTFVARLTFEQKSTYVDIDDSINQKFIEISNRQASFNNMSTDEKLAEIANLIESLLKKNGKFLTPDYSTICFDYISNDVVTSYRKKMHCFRHATDDAISERKNYSEEQKSEFGHLEGDTIVGNQHKSAVITLVERLSKCIIAIKPKGRKAKDIEESLNGWLQNVPKHLFKSIIFDCEKGILKLEKR